MVNRIAFGHLVDGVQAEKDMDSVLGQNSGHNQHRDTQKLRGAESEMSPPEVAVIRVMVAGMSFRYRQMKT